MARAMIWVEVRKLTTPCQLGASNTMIMLMIRLLSNAQWGTPRLFRRPSEPGSRRHSPIIQLTRAEMPRKAIPVALGDTTASISSTKDTQPSPRPTASATRGPPWAVRVS